MQKHESLQPLVNMADGSGITRSNEFIEAIDVANAGNSELLPKSFISPIFMMWDITYHCPFNCIFCFNDSGGTKYEDELDLTELLRIADEIIQEQVISVCLCGGEPFSRFDEFVKISEKLCNGGVIVNCVSNGWYITPDILNRISGKIKTIQFSLDGPDAQTHDRLRGKKGAFDQVMKAIRYVSESSFKTCELTFIPTKINYRLFMKVVKLAIDLGCISKIRTQHLIQTGRGHQFDLTLDKAEEKEFETLFSETFNKYNHQINLVFGDPWAHINDWRKEVIPPLFLQITAQGLTKISPYIPLTVGYLTKESLASVWKRVNDNRDRINQYLKDFNAMNTFPDNQIPWINHDLELVGDLL